MVDRFDPPRDPDWKPLPMRSDIAGQKSAVMPHYTDITRGYANGRSGARDAILAAMEPLK